ncbi:MAG: hypothetical protein L3J15_05875 [Devosiaceae bacterium]|nr:hypothetical protein [Devosiaceae bacterium]
MVLTVELVALIAAPAGIAVGIVIWFFREIGKVRKDITDHKLYASEHYATKSGLTASLNRVHDSIDSLTSRIDELLRELTSRN